MQKDEESGNILLSTFFQRDIGGDHEQLKFSKLLDSTLPRTNIFHRINRLFKLSLERRECKFWIQFLSIERRRIGGENDGIRRKNRGEKEFGIGVSNAYSFGSRS